MARAQGARAQMALAFETDLRHAARGAASRSMPFASTTLGAEQPLLNSELSGLWPRPAGADQGRGDGGWRCRRAARRRGFRLLAEGGFRCTDRPRVRIGPWTAMSFSRASWTSCPAISIETGMPEVPRYAMYSGCVLDQTDLADAAFRAPDRDRAAGGAG